MWKLSAPVFECQYQKQQEKWEEAQMVHLLRTLSVCSFFASERRNWQLCVCKRRFKLCVWVWMFVRVGRNKIISVLVKIVLFCDYKRVLFWLLLLLLLVITLLSTGACVQVAFIAAAFFLLHQQQQQVLPLLLTSESSRVCRWNELLVPVDCRETRHHLIEALVVNLNRTIKHLKAVALYWLSSTALFA